MFVICSTDEPMVYICDSKCDIAFTEGVADWTLDAMKAKVFETKKDATIYYVEMGISTIPKTEIRAYHTVQFWK